MTHVRGTCLFNRVVIDVDNVIEHAYCCARGLFQFLQIQLAVFDVLNQVDGAKVTNGYFVSRCVQGDFCTQI